MPTCLDLFCCEGGAARGYQRAGFHVTGVDLAGRFSRRYAGDAFVQADAIEFAREHGHEFDFIHASPPCQRYSVTNHNGREYPDLIAPTRAALEGSGRPWVIENVVGAPLIDPLLLCGSMFDLVAVDDDGTPLRMERHRLFESNLRLAAPEVEHRHPPDVQVGGSYGGARRDKWEARHVRRGGYVPSKRVQEELLGIDWMTLHGLHQSIPPAYAEFIGGQVRAHLAGGYDAK